MLEPYFWMIYEERGLKFSENLMITEPVICPAVIQYPSAYMIVEEKKLMIETKGL